MTRRILVMGLPGAGKTTFTQDLVRRLMINHSVKWFNADAVREEYNDWDFSPEGRLRQVQRMRDLADKSGAEFAICDFVCPTEEYRKVFNADIVIWLDTIPEGRFDDTNRLFEPPTNYSYRIRNWHNNEKTLDLVLLDLSMFRDTNKRSIVKAISWRLLGTIDTFLLTWLVTGEVHIAAAIGGVEIVTKTLLYWLHERTWNRIKWGRG